LNNHTIIDYTDHQPLVFHIIPHSHCDAAYKKTFDEYYETEVRNVLISVLEAIPRDPSRRFVWAETIFLTRWWKDPRTTAAQKKLFQELLNNGRLEIVNGGWVMHDEGITRYDSQIHQMTLGHDRLQQILVDEEGRFNLSIKTGWQIDPFGPSPFTVNLHAWAGMDFLVLNRMPDDVKDRLKSNRSLQFYWETGQPSTKQQSTIARVLVHVMDTHYASPPGFDWEDVEHELPDQITDGNVQDRTDEFMKILMQRASYYQTPHVMVPMGGDFTFQNASMQFRNIDRIMEHVRGHPEVYSSATLKYSTPTEYKEAVLGAIDKMNHQLPVIHGGVDMQPLLAGYYFQNPNLKQKLRSLEIVLRTLEVQSFRALREGQPWEWLSPLVERTKSIRDTMGLMQHHDAITATSYRFVIGDYIRRISSSFAEMTNLLGMLHHGPTDDEEKSCSHPALGKIVGGGHYLHESVLIRDTQSARSIAIDKVVNPQMGQGGISLVILNSLASSVDSTVHFVCTRDDVAVSLVNDDGSLQSIPAQATPLDKELEVSSLGLFLISFPVSVGSFDEERVVVQVCDLTWNTFQKPQKLPNLRCADRTTPMSADEVINHGLNGPRVHVQFDSKTFDLTSLTTNLSDGSVVATKLSHDFVLYNATNDTVYSFNTNIENSNPKPLFEERPRTIINAERGLIFSQVTLEYTPWLRVRYRVFHFDRDLTSLQLQVTVFAGPLPPNVNLASRINCDWLDTEWYIEENGFLPVQVFYNTSHAVGDGNSRPLVSRTWMMNLEKQLSITSVDPRAIVSKKSGEMDIFWHRRNAYPGDWWREGDDVSSLVASVWISLSTPNQNNQLAKSVSTQLASDLVLLEIEAFKPRERYKYLDIEEKSPSMHVVTLRLSQVDDDLPTRRDEAWLDLQIENLSHSNAGEVPLNELFRDVSSRVFWNAGRVQTLTFLSSDVLEKDCRLVARLGGKKMLLVVSPRRICSIRVPVSALSENNTSNYGISIKNS
jgi:hypothetical protein